MKQYFVYVLASRMNGTLYIGVTDDLVKRVYEHKHDLAEGFTKKYGVHSLVHYEITNNVNEAILREKKLKRWKREWKVILIEKANPDWKDLYDRLI